MISDGFNAQLEGYISDVLENKIVTSVAVRAAVERHVRDLQRQSTADFPYHFDPSLAAKTCRFFPTVLRHSIGKYAGMPFDLEPWQVFCTSMIFGWLRDCDNTRRFRKAYRSMARKNGKSTWLSGESLFMAGFDSNPITGKPESVAQVVMAASKRDQVNKVLFAECKRMRGHSPAIESRSRFVRGEIVFAHNNGEIVTTGSDRPFDGLNPHAVIMDELQAWREHHREFYDTMVTGSGSRNQPLISVITTAGDDESHLWKEIYTYARSVATGDFEDDSYFAFIAEIDENDNPLEEANWIKANPNLGVSIPLDYLQNAAKEASQSSIALNRFTRYHCNQSVSAVEQAFNMQEWDACEGELSDWSMADAIGGGFDLGGRDDLAAYGLVARFPMAEDSDGNTIWRYEARAKCYIAQDTERDLSQQPWATWKYLDLLQVCKYPTTELFGSLVEDVGTYGVWAVAFDPYNGQAISEQLKEEGIEAVRMAQNYLMFNEPIHDLLAAIREGRFRHDGNPLLRWCVNNAAISRDRNDRWMFDKRDSAGKIDAIVAVTMAFRMATLARARATGMLFIS